MKLQRRFTRLAVGATGLVVVAGALFAGRAADAAQDTYGHFPAKPGAPGVGDEVYPNLGNGGYQVDKYELDLKWDPAAKLVAGEVKIHARATQNLSSFNLDSRELRIDELRVDGSTEQWTQEGEELVVRPEWPIRNGKPIVVTVKYTADPAKVSPFDGGGWVPTIDGFATAPQPAGAHTVFPSNDHPSDKARFVFRITAPKGSLGVASGEHKGDRVNADGSTTSTYETRNPLATELVQATVGDYKVIERGQDGTTRLRDVVPSARAEQTEPALKLTAGQIAWIKQHLGELPLEAYGILPANSDVEKPFDFTGLETQTLTIYRPKYLLQAESVIGSHMMHELVHNWFGNSVTPASWSDLWLNEGHADYYGLLYRYERGWPDSRGYKTMEERMKYTYGEGDKWRASSGPVAKPNAKNLFDNQRYTGAVLVLYALREKIGQEKFTAIENAVLTRYRNGNLSTAQYIDLAAEVADDESVRPFLTDWLYGTKTPPMPNHPDWAVTPPTATTRTTTDLQSDRHGR